MGVPPFAKSKTSSKGVIRVLGPPEGSQVPQSGFTNLSHSDLREWPGERMALPCCWGLVIENKFWHLANESIGNNGVKEQRG